MTQTDPQTAFQTVTPAAARPRSTRLALFRLTVGLFPALGIALILAVILAVRGHAETTTAKKPVHPAAAVRHRATSHGNPAAAASRSARKPVRHAHPVPDISPERGTAAAEEVQATLADAPLQPFLYPRALEPFFRALARLGGGAANPDAQSSIPALADTVRVLQFGDSHTAADLFSGRMRANLQSRFGNGGLGFQFPGHPFAGYHLSGSERSQTSGWRTTGNKFTQLGDTLLGLGGISIETSRPGESISVGTTCTTLQVEYLRQPRGGRLRLTDNGVFISEIDTGLSSNRNDEALQPSPADAGEPAAATSGDGDAGALTYACTSGVHDFRLTTLDAAPVRLLGLVTEQPGITYECLGINGAVAPLMLRWNQQMFAEFLRQRDPTLIVLAYGTNEAAESASHNEDYVAAFAQLIKNLHRIVPEAAILVLGPYDRATRLGRGHRAAWQTFRGTDRIIADQKEACREFHCAYYDERARMGGPGAMMRWVSAGMAQPDRTHLTGTGYRALADALYLDLLTAYKTYQTALDAAARLSPRRSR